MSQDYRLDKIGLINRDKKISFKFGKGSYLFSSDNKKYLDFVQGIAVNSLGHSHPKLIKTIKKPELFNEKLFGKKFNITF